MYRNRPVMVNDGGSSYRIGLPEKNHETKQESTKTTIAVKTPVSTVKAGASDKSGNHEVTQQVRQAAARTPAATKRSAAVYNAGSLIDLKLGPISAQAADKLVQSGQVTATEKNGQIYLNLNTPAAARYDNHGSCQSRHNSAAQLRRAAQAARGGQDRASNADAAAAQSARSVEQRAPRDADDRGGVFGTVIIYPKSNAKSYNSSNNRRKP